MRTSSPRSSTRPMSRRRCTLEFGEEDPITEKVRVPANTTVSLGVTDDALLIEGLDTPAGADVLVYFQSGDSEGAEVAVPVLDGTLDYLSEFVP